MRYLYSLLFYLALPFIFVRLLWRSLRAPDYRRRWAERLGFCPQELTRCIWLHAVSVGETIAAVPLINALKAKYPHLPLLITNMTPTGSARVKAIFGDKVLNAYLPYDLPDAVDRFLDRVNPMVLIVMETELWPNLFAACQAREIPVIVTNARLSAKSAVGYQRIAPLTREMLNTIDVLAVQTQADAERFVELGMPPQRIQIVGNLKFDLALPADLPQKSSELRAQLGNDRLVWIAASTHPGEDEAVLAAHRKIKEKISNALLILVPRHPERFDAVAALVTQKDFHLARRSQQEICQPDTDVYLGDTMGELLTMYGASDVAFVAGSLAKVGGHNMIEAAALRKAIITGPQLFNFVEASELLLAANGMLKISNVRELTQAVIELLSDENRRHQLGENAYQVVEKNRGSLERQLDLIRKSKW